MSDFKRFMAIYILIVVTISFFIAYCTRSLENEQENLSSDLGENHFSVVWKGFKPDYSNQTPDYYVCINDLKDDVLNMNIAMRIENYENSSLWFLIGSYVTPPAEWTITTYYIGLVDIDTTREFHFSSISRTRPTFISDGRMTESVELVVKAYSDPSYLDLHS